MAVPAELGETSIRTLVERLASRDPVPGGGSAAAYAGALAAALVHMVVELSTGRPGSAASGEAALRDIGLAATSWQSELLNLAQLDANAYAAVVAARHLPLHTDQQRDARSVQLAAAIREATRVPLQAAEAAAQVLELAEQIAPLGNPHAISDTGVAAHLALAAVHGALLNVRINLPLLDDGEDLREEATARLASLAREAQGRFRVVAALVDERMGATPS